MKKAICILAAVFLSFLSPTFASIIVDDIEFDLNGFNWGTKSYYSGLWYSSVGYFHMQRFDGSMDIYGSNRYVDDFDVDCFFNSLEPLEKNFLPYASPYWKNEAVYTILSYEDAFIDELPAKKLLIQIDYPSNRSEVVISYLFTKKKIGFFSDSILGYTVSFSCPSNKYQKMGKIMENIAKAMIVH